MALRADATVKSVSATVGYEASFAVFDISRDKLKVNRYYIDSSLNSQLYANGQFEIVK